MATTRTRRGQPASSDTPQARDRLGGRDWLIALVLAAVTVGVYAGVRNHEFVNYDDPYYVTENAHVRAGFSWPGTQWAFSTFEDGNWFPLTWLSHMADVSVWGLHPGGHHLTSVILHALCAAALFLLLRSMELGCAPSVLAAALFALHPQRVESVAWIAERKDILSGLLSVLTLAAYIAYGRTPRGSRYLLVAALFAAALMSKAMPITLPFVMLLLDVWPLGRSSAMSSGRLVREKIPFFAMSVAAGVISVAAQSQIGAVATLDHIPLEARLSNAVQSYAAYLIDLLWPASLAVFYPRVALPAWQLAAAVLVLSAVTWWAWRQRSRHPHVFVGWAWYVGMLVPVIGLVQIGAQARADRYTYLPMIGIVIAVAALAQSAAQQRPGLRVPLAAAAFAAVLVSAGLTIRQIGVWRDSVTLFEHAKRVTPPSYPVLSNLAEALVSRGDFNRAVQAFAEAAKVAPANAVARVNLATALQRAGLIDQSAAEFREALRLQPDNVTAVAGFGVALARQGKREEAIAVLRAAIGLDPSLADVHYNLGNLLVGAGRLDEAAGSFQAVIGLRPNDAAARSNLGVTLARLGRYDAAIEQFEAVLRIDPSLDQVRNNLAQARALKGR